MSDSIVTLTDLTKEFQSGEETIRVLDRLTVSFNAGSKVIVTGESGSGKSTMLNLIAGLEETTSGTVEVNGYAVDQMNETELALFRKKNIGLVFQFHYLLNDFTALENILLPARMGGMPLKQSKELATDLLHSVGLTNRATHYPTQLSGGERQRIAVARALINDPQIVLADEPTGNLDEQNSSVVEDLLFSIVDQYQKTLVLVTHDKSLCQHGDVHYHLKGGVLENQ